MRSKFTAVGTQITEVKEEIGSLSTWQKETNKRIEKLELKEKELSTSKEHQEREVTRIDTAQAANETEMTALRKKMERVTQQLIETQAVVKKNYNETNKIGRAVCNYNLRIGNIAEAVTPDPRGVTHARKPREDTKQLVAEFLIETGLYTESLDTEEAKNIIDLAYRTGKVERNKVRNVFVKFKCVDDRNRIMREGKVKERNKDLDDKFLMDDHTPEDYSQKRRCHAIMKHLKDKDKRPHFIGGRLRSTDGFVAQKTVRDFNKAHKVEDKRRVEITPDRFTMHLSEQDVKNKEAIEDEEEDRRKKAADKRKADEQKDKGDEQSGDD